MNRVSSNLRCSVLIALSFFGAVGNALAGPVERWPAIGSQPRLIGFSGREFVLYEQSHALLVSAGKYLGRGEGGWAKLDNVHRELDEIGVTLTAHGFSVVRVYDPTGKELTEQLSNFVARYGRVKESRIIVLFSGHGYTKEETQMGYFVPVDAKLPTVDEVDFFSKAMPLNQIKDVTAFAIEAKHALFVFDSCFSGAIFGTKGGGHDLKSAPLEPTERFKYLKGLSDDAVRQFISAGDAKEQLPAISEFLSLFSYALKNGLPTKGDDYVTGQEIGRWLEESVPTATNGAQNPHSRTLLNSKFRFGDMIFHVPSGGRMGQKIGGQTIQDWQHSEKQAADAGAKKPETIVQPGTGEGPTCSPNINVSERSIKENQRYSVKLGEEFRIPDECQVVGVDLLSKDQRGIRIDGDSFTFEPEEAGQKTFEFRVKVRGGGTVNAWKASVRFLVDRVQGKVISVR